VNANVIPYHPVPAKGYGLQTLAKYKRKAENLPGSQAKAAVVKLFYKMKPSTLKTSFRSYSDTKRCIIATPQMAGSGWPRMRTEW